MSIVAKKFISFFLILSSLGFISLNVSAYDLNSDGEGDCMMDQDYDQFTEEQAHQMKAFLILFTEISDKLTHLEEGQKKIDQKLSKNPLAVVDSALAYCGYNDEERKNFMFNLDFYQISTLVLAAMAVEPVLRHSISLGKSAYIIAGTILWTAQYFARHPREATTKFNTYLNRNLPFAMRATLDSYQKYKEKLPQQ